MKRHPRRWLTLLVLLLALAAGLAYLALRYVEATARRAARDPSAPPIRVVIEPGMNAPEIFRSLQRAGLIADARLAGLYYRLHGHATLKAGEYEFGGELSFEDMLRKMEKGEVLLHTFTIPEGLTIQQIAQHLQGLGVCACDEYVRAAGNATLISRHDPEARDLEGYLFPSTYAFPSGFTADAVVARQVHMFLDTYLTLRKAASPVLGFREAVIMASLVEEETGRPEERPLVASVFFNRLNRRMLLQCDPTVIYALMKEGRYDGRIYRSSLVMDSPYNTYRYPGLPPGPICNPGEASLKAALAPPPTSYLYFVARTDATHVFSDNLNDHNRAVARYQR